MILLNAPSKGPCKSKAGQPISQKVQSLLGVDPVISIKSPLKVLKHAV
jgi:hypothetical protein